MTIAIHRVVDARTHDPGPVEEAIDPLVVELEVARITVTTRTNEAIAVDLVPGLEAAHDRAATIHVVVMEGLDRVILQTRTNGLYPLVPRRHLLMMAPAVDRNPCLRKKAWRPDKATP
jgi:hypothetical protein